MSDYGRKSLGHALASFGYKFGTTGLVVIQQDLIYLIQIPLEEWWKYRWTSTRNGYTYHVFTSSGSLVISTVNSSTDIEYLVAAGGGTGGTGESGGSGGGGGQNSGGVVVDTHPITGSVTYPVTVGTGGADSSIGSLLTTTRGGNLCSILVARTPILNLEDLVDLVVVVQTILLQVQEDWWKKCSLQNHLHKHLCRLSWRKW